MFILRNVLFEGQVHQVAYLSAGEARGRWGRFQAMDKGLCHSGCGTLHAEGIFGQKQKLAISKSSKSKVHTPTKRSENVFVDIVYVLGHFLLIMGFIISLD